MPENKRAGAEPRPAKPKYPAWYATALKLYKKPLDVDTDDEFITAASDFADLSAGERGFFLVHMAFLGLQGLWMVVRLLMECRDGLEEVAELLERGLPNLVGPVDTVAGDDDELPPEPDEAPSPSPSPSPKVEVIPLKDGVDLIVPEDVNASIAVDLVLPYGRRVFGVDPIAAFLGRPLDDVLASVMRGPPTVRRDAGGQVSEVYPLFLPDGEGAAVPLGAFGELGFANDGGLLVLSVPLVAAREVVRQLGDAVVGGPDRRPTAAGPPVAEIRVRVRAGWRRSFKVGVLGEIAVETPA